MKKSEVFIPRYQLVGAALLVLIPRLLTIADPRVNSFPSLYEDDSLPPDKSASLSKQTITTIPQLVSSKSQLNGAEFGKRIQAVPPPASPAQIIKSIAASSTPVWTSSRSSLATSKIASMNDQSQQKTTSSSNYNLAPTKSLVMQNLATGEIYMKRSPVTNIEQQLQQQSSSIPAGVSQPEAPKHWSSLENYLRMVRANALKQQPYYQTVSDEYIPSLHGDRDASLPGQGYLVQIARPGDPNGATLILPYSASDLNQQQRLILPVPQSYQSDSVARQNSKFEDNLNAKRIESYVPSRTRDELTRLFQDSKYDDLSNNDYSSYRAAPFGLQTNARNVDALDSQVQLPQAHISRYPYPIGQHHQASDRAYCLHQNQIGSTKAINDMYNIAKSQQQLDLMSRRIDVDLTPNAYPSHMGIYNGSQASVNNHLCGATLIHQSFALTIASCLHGIDVFDNLTIQAGEWNYLNYTKNGIDPPIRRKIKSVSVHPLYRSQNWRDNIALVQFDQPIGIIAGYIYPACQQYSRIQLRANSCWVPARNITKTSTFDPEGDGLTRDSLELKMVELPVKLIPNDDLECQRETRMEAFNFGNPGLICSNEYKQLKKRIESNELEILGSGIYCEEGGILNLVSIFHPAGYEMVSSKSDVENLLLRKLGQPTSPGLIDLSYYKHWIDTVIRNKEARGQLSMYLVAAPNDAA